MDSHARDRWRFLAILTVAAALRFVGLDWDGGHAFHPDERRIAFALGELSFRPLQLNPHFFAYGSFPLYLQKIWVSVLGWWNPSWQGFHGEIFAARIFSAIVGVAMVAGVGALARRLYGERAALLAALFMALCVLPIQHSHFITFDLYQAALATFALERFVAHAQDGRRATFLQGATITGLAFATKVSSAPLLLPLAATPLLAARKTDAPYAIGSRLGLVLVGLVLAAIAFLCGEPYALLDRAAFLHDVREQSAMVRNAGSVPYTIQYLGTTAYLDDLRAAFTWGMGPGLGFVALVGTLAAIVRVARQRRRDELVVLSFFLPYLLVTGAFPVKFMRYLLPLYPLWCVYAAAVLTSGDDWRRRAAAWVAVGVTAAYAVAFGSIYWRPHPWIEASRWFDREIPKNAMVLTPHWEEGFPVDVDGRRVGPYRHGELPLYEHDSEKKLALLATRLAEGDVLVFPSQRLYGSISNAPERYPQTSRLIELLFTGDLGYRLDRVFASRPTLFGLELNDDYADESFSVYDHPKTLVFRKVEALAADDVAARVRSRVPSRPIRRADLLGAEASGSPAAVAASRRIDGNLPALATWLVALAALSFTGTRIIGAVLPRAPDFAIAGLGPPVGYLVFAYSSWIGPALGFVSFTGTETLILGVLLVFVSRRWRRARSVLASGFFYGAFAFFLAIRAWNPEIFWGEKPMDFSFLNSLYRTVAIPPAEPWMSGKAVNYSYFGHFGVAALGKLTGVSPALAFNLGIATIGALTASAAFGAGALLTRRASGGVIAALLVAFAGNLSGPFVRWNGPRSIGFDYFWATSRVIADTINEFPLWSFLFADLHAHVMALPLSVLLLALIQGWFANLSARSFPLLCLASLTLGAIATTNSWGLPIYGAVTAGAAVLAASVDRRPQRFFFAPLMLAFSFLWFLPYWQRFVPPPPHWGLESAAAPLSGVLAIFGLFLYGTVRAVWIFAARAACRLPYRIAWLVTLAVVAGLSTRGGFFFLGTSCLAAALVAAESPARMAFALAGAAAMLGGLADTFFLWDRMNTIFKSYMEIWLLLSLTCAWGFSSLRVRGGARWLDRVAVSALLLLSVFTAVTDVVATLRTERAVGRRPTIDGVAYLESQRPLDAMAIRWLDRNILGSPVLLEAYGPSYQEFGRISMNTGLPAVLGWDYHLSQRAHAWSEINARKAAVRTLYTSEDRDEVAKLITAYGVAVVYVGELERRTYPSGLEKFDSWREVFQPIYRNPGVAIYAVTANFRWADTSPIVEEPRAAAEEPDAPPEPLPPGQLRQPRGVAVDGDGNVWVADFGNNRVQGFDSSLRPLREFGSRGEIAGRFRDPCGIAVGPDGLLYVADTWNHRIQVLDRDGRAIRQWQAEFYGPRGVAVARDGTVYVTDTGNGRIARFTATGGLLGRFGGKGAGRGQLDEPIGIAISDEGKVYVADAGNRRIVVFSTDGTELATWPVPGWDPQVFREPYLAVLADGRIVASDPTGDRLLIFDASGRLVHQHALQAGSNPTGVAQLRDGGLVVGALKFDAILPGPHP